MQDKRSRPKGHFSHILIMVLCCVIPLALIGILWAAGIRSSYLTLGLVLLCPLTHVVMMLFMRKESSDDNEHMH
jgi:hypothetical protein